MKYFMKQWFLEKGLKLTNLSLLSLLFVGVCFSPSILFSEEISLSTKTEAMAHFYQLPLCFEKNEGQVDASVKYLARGLGYTFYFTPKEVVMVLQKCSEEGRFSATLKMQFIGAKQDPLIKGLEKQECKSNYFIGNDPQKWQSNISNYAKVCYQDLYPGIQATFYGNNKQFEYDFCVSPGANPQDIRLHIEGAKELSLDHHGNLCILTENGEEMQMQKPFIYQMIKGEKIIIEGHLVLLAQNDVGFALASYDESESLVIDPLLVYSTYLGGTDFDQGNGIAIDNLGNAYVTGFTASVDFPITPNAFQSTFGGVFDAFITKLNPDGTALIYSTYLGGSDDDQADSIAIDGNGNAYVTGTTSSTNFPVTVNAFQTTLNGAQNVFMTKLDATGSNLLYSTYLGGSSQDIGFGIALDADANAYLTGIASSPDFPITPGAFQSTLPGISNAFVAKINPSSSGPASLIYSTYLGGNNIDAAISIAVDNQGDAYVTGRTTSSDFPTTPGAFQTTLNGSSNAFVTKLNPTGSALVYSTFLGGSSSDIGLGIALNGSGNAYVTGQTFSNDFPTTPGAFQPTIDSSSGLNAFVTQLNTTASALVYSTFLGGSSSDGGNGIAVDSSGNAYIVGITTSPDFPITSNAFQTQFGGIQDAFISKLNPQGSALLYSTFLGGSNIDIGIAIAVDQSGNAYVTGQTVSTNFPVTPGAFQTMLNGSAFDAFVAKIATANATTTTLTVSPQRAHVNQPVTLTATVTPSSATGTVTFFDGGVPIAIIPLVNGTASFTTSFSTLGKHFLTAVYNGDTNNLPSTSPTVTLRIVGVKPPKRLKGFQKFRHCKFVNILTWKTPANETSIVTYQIFRNSLNNLIGTVSSQGKLQFKDHNVKRGKTYTYFVVAVDAFGNTSQPAKVVVESIVKKRCIK